MCNQGIQFVILRYMAIENTSKYNLQHLEVLKVLCHKNHYGACACVFLLCMDVFRKKHLYGTTCHEQLFHYRGSKIYLCY